MTAATAQVPEHTAMGRLLDVIERAGNRVPHPVMMFLYLIIGVILLSAALAFAGVSVTDEIAVPDAVPVTPNYYEDSTQPILDPDVARLRLRGRLPPRAGHDPDPEPPRCRGHPVPVHLVRAELRGVRRHRGHVRRADGGRRGRGERAHGRAHPAARRGLAATPARVRADLRGRPVEHRDRRRLPDPRAARGSGLHERRPPPARRDGGVLRGRRRDLRRQPDPRPDRRPDHRDHQRGARCRRQRAAHDPRQLLVQHRVVDPARDRRRAHHRTRDRAAAGRVPAGDGGRAGWHLHRGRRRHRARSGVRAARPALRAHRLRGLHRARPPAHPPARRAAARSR